MTMAKPLRITHALADVFVHLDHEWTTVSQIHGLLGFGSDPTVMAPNTVKNSLKKLVDLGVAEEAANLFPKRFRATINPDPATQSIITLIEDAHTQYGRIPQ